jgi:selenocysteine-specific elongation factor
MDIIAGTAGHIDHGKTALIKALTGIDADRLPEEKQRGITIDLGFAELELGDIRFGFVDVPGHERFVKNMLAGASGIDLVLLVIAADEGVMPQTREHFDICRLLGIKTGLVVLTKKDLADDDTLELVKMQVADLVADSFLDAAPVVAVSSKTGEGLDDLRRALAAAARKVPERSDQYVTRLPIDRSFSVKGFGTVVTGTLSSGAIREGDELEILPGGDRVRVRGLQTHGKQVNEVRSGQRTAVNLGGIDYSEVSRGMELTEKGMLRPTQMLDTRVEVVAGAVRPLRSRQRVRVHIGTAEILARVSVLNDLNEIAPGRQDFVQLRLESPAVAPSGEKFVLRSYSPQMTIAGGTVLDPLAAKHHRKNVVDTRSFLSRLEQSLTKPSEQVRLLVELAGERGLSVSDLHSRTGLRQEVLDKALKENIRNHSIVAAEGLFLTVRYFTDLKDKVLNRIEMHHKREPLSKGISRETLREQVFAHIGPEVFRHVLSDLENTGKIIVDRDTLRVADHGAKLSAEETTVLERLSKMYGTAGLEVPKLADAFDSARLNLKIDAGRVRKVFQLLLDSNEIVKVTEEFYFSTGVIVEMKRKLAEFAKTAQGRMIDVPQFKEIAGISRKYAIPLLEYFDREKVTRRAGDKRIIL